MEIKKAKDTTKEDHFIQIVVGVKIIYNQNEYLAYTEVPKKNRSIPLEIYIGRLSVVRDQYLLFKCETASEKESVFSLFKKIFLGEKNDEIEFTNYSHIDRISVVSSNEFDEKMDQYPNFFELPNKEDEIDATITLPKFLLKKTPVSKQKETEIISNDEPALELPAGESDALHEEHKEENQDQVPTISDDFEPANLKVDQKEEKEPLKSEETVNLNSNLDMDSYKEVMMPEVTSREESIPEKEDRKIEEQITVDQIPEEDLIPVTSKSPIYDEKPKKRKLKTKSVLLLILLLLIIVGGGIGYFFMNLEKEPKKQEKPPVQNNVQEKKTENLVCVLETEDSDTKDVIQHSNTFVYEVQSKKIIKAELTTNVKMEDAIAYALVKADFESNPVSKTAGKEVKYTFDDTNLTYQTVEKRNYEKITEPEKDETWKENFEQTNDYYLNLGYTCNGVNKAENENKENQVNLTSTSGSAEVNYNNWIVKMKSATLSSDKSVMKIELDVTNNDAQKRALNGLLKLYNKEGIYLRNITLNGEVESGQSMVISLETKKEGGEPSIDSSMPNTEPVELDLITSYLIELYR